MLLDILQLTIYGIVIGSIISLGAIGVSLTFGILRFANFAHGDLMTFGAYVAFTVYTILGLPLWLGLPAAMVATVILAFVMDRVVFIRLRRKNPVVLLIASFGIALMIRSAVQIIWGPETQVYVQGIQLPWKFAGLRLKPDQLTILIAAAILVFALHLFLTRSKVGKAMRAMADNPDLARISGIDTERIVLWTWGIGAALAAAAGIFLGLDTRLLPEMGWFILLPIFAAAILGGIGKPYGAVAGGLIIGVAQELSTLVIDPSYKAAVAFAIMVIVLIIRPTGIFSGRS
jgi:branched-chain amino acid transport system permease protein/neutral amino acid transport system permease protein